MEFEHVGQHCSLPTCRQKDFLPFHCDFCRKAFCLEHRSYAAHGCGGAASKDMTSIDCPICGQAVKFDKAQNADEVWNAHYVRGCTQQPAPVKVTQNCARPDCRQHLGPSNGYTCPKCRKVVCLSHRLPEDHRCGAAAAKPSANPRGQFLDRLEAQKKKAPTPSSATSSSKANSAKTKESEENTLRGTAHRRMPPTTITSRGGEPVTAPLTTPVATPPSAATGSDFQCPLCGVDQGGSEALQLHVQHEHADVVGGPFSAAVPAARAHALGREVCPHCQQRFMDAVALVDHVERAHVVVESAGSATPAAGRQCALS